MNLRSLVSKLFPCATCAKSPTEWQMNDLFVENSRLNQDLSVALVDESAARASKAVTTSCLTSLRLKDMSSIAQLELEKGILTARNQELVEAMRAMIASEMATSVA